MPYFFFKLTPPRPTFMQDFTPAEGAIMAEHAAYWRGLMDEGRVVAFGPVADPNGAYGIGLINMDDDDAAHAIGANDPAVRSGAGFSIEMHPMASVVLASTSG